MDAPDPGTWAPLLALYPEIHYRFRFFPFSGYYRPRPEILTDAPVRLEPGRPLPLLLLIKDAHRFPVTLDLVQVEAATADRRLTHTVDLGETIADPWWSRLLWLDLPDVSPAEWEISVTWRLRQKGRKYLVRNDNFRGLSHGPLQVRQSGHAWPAEPGWAFGDLHLHTSYTRDHVEFGAPLYAVPEMGLAQGLSFALAADHSYDLDDREDSFTRNDPALPLFHRRTAELDDLNRRYHGSFVLLPGFELSAGNARGKTVHLLMAGQREFLPGSGDSAERWLDTRPETSIAEALARRTPGSLAMAAHPMAQTPLLQRLLLGRGSWEEPDLALPGLDGLQVWNGSASLALERGLDRWVKGLLEGRRWRIFAGSDAHGNFNRNRQVSFPMVKLKEWDHHVLGRTRTGVFLPSGVSEAELLEALARSRSLITDGPFVVLEPEEGKILARARSSPEFGSLEKVAVYAGFPGETGERVLLEESAGGGYAWEAALPRPEAEPPRGAGGYLRMAAMTETGRRAWTNPLWLSDPPR
jgi:hypothetical protein